MMPKQIIGVADLNFPGPNSKAIAATVKAMPGGKRPLTTERVAKVLSCTVGQVEYGLNIAKQMGLVRKVPKGWIAG